MPDDDTWHQLARELHLPDIAPECLRQAFAHPSYVWETGEPPLSSNQRLEFLGDAILDAIIADELCRRFPDMAEGELTRAKSALVQEDSLAKIARQLDLGNYLLLGRGEENSGGREKSSVLADVLEALLGAIYTSAGTEAATEFVLEHFAEIVAQVSDHSLRDAKTALQELLQARVRETPVYVTVSASGPPHEPVFEAEVYFGDRVLGKGTGHSKQQAEQAAAHQALADKERWLPEVEQT